jgi:uncharacterized protein YyaL (SSP411 family)
MRILPPLLVTLMLWAGQHPDTNHLIHEASPYLQRHAHNPVDWYPWGDEAFEKARKEHKPIFLSIGYSTCHWCHVMEAESFENEAVAEAMNRDFVSIKVDREEMPHIDSYYQKLHLLLKKRTGGWPLTVILTETRQPVFIATYLPPEDGYGTKGMLTLLPEIARQYREDRPRIETTARAIEALMQRLNTMEYARKEVSPQLAARALKAIKSDYDPRHHGFSERPKFPESSLIELLLDIYRLQGDPDALQMARNTLGSMAGGGIYDQVDGAFYRYAVDRKWEIPHFEKMLYTNAELIPCYLRLYAIDKAPLYARIVRETIAEVDRRFKKEGLYFSASDVDSGGEEGGYFLHTHASAKKSLIQSGFREQEADAVLAYLGITEAGNVDGEKSNPHIASDRKPKRLEEAREVLRQIREKRPYPFVDTKVITAWNAMQIDALFKASVLDKAYLQQAEHSLETLLKHAYKDKVLYHQFLYGRAPAQQALLEDYAFLVRALLTGYAHTFREHYLRLADRLTSEAVKRFHRKGRWYLSDDAFDSVADLSDRYYTSPLSVMIGNLLGLAALQENLEYYGLAESTLRHYAYLLDRNPSHYPEATRAMLRYRKGDVVLKSNRGKLAVIKEQIGQVDYPYLLVKTEATDRYLACRVGICFAYGREFRTVKKAIEALR